MRFGLAALCAFSFASVANAWTVVGSGLSGWSVKPITVQYNFSSCPLPEATVLSALDQAISILNSSRDTGLQLVRASSAVTTTSADIANQTAALTPVVVCDAAFSANQTLDADVIPAVTRLGASGGRVSFAGLILNAEAGKNAVISSLSTDKLVVVLVHELGHVLGMGHSSNVDAIMYYSISSKTSAILTQDDMDGISHLYPRNELSGGFYGCANTHQPRSSKNALWVLALLAVNLVFGRAWLARLRPEPLL